MIEFILLGMGLLLIQIVAALPWIVALDPAAFKAWLRRAVTTSLGLQVVVGTLAGMVGMLFLFYTSVTEPNQRSMWARGYASILQLQLSADLFVLIFVIMLRLWPQGGAVALAAFREGMRQPLFWILTLGALMLMALTPLLPYFTFGEDYKMVKEIGYDTIMLAATAFGVIAASMSIGEEIEGKTAITLMSKPISRRQFLLGKFGGILLAALAMTLMLGFFFIWMLLFKEKWDPNSTPNPTERGPDPQWVMDFVNNLPLEKDSLPIFFGIGLWTHDLMAIGLGLVLGFCQLMVLLAIAVALATRLPMLVNLVICLLVFFLGHLTPILTVVSRDRYALVYFTSQVFDTLLPGLEYYDMGPATVTDAPPPQGDFALYVLSVTGYSVLYSTIALLFGLILFEDRDLA
jgi:hypothetical protein